MEKQCGPMPSVKGQLLKLGKLGNKRGLVRRIVFTRHLAFRLVPFLA